MIGCDVILMFWKELHGACRVKLLFFPGLTGPLRKLVKFLVRNPLIRTARNFPENTEKITFDNILYRLISL
ncbi:hypothetical protein evm_007121 [Chilo suppressalis]|nr:hypothetical protein evm_007121 [Chilo suppressalis]